MMRRDDERPVRLSRRELEVLHLAVTGCTVKEMALRLGIGAKSVYTYRDRLRRKLGLRTHSDFVIAWLTLTHEGSPQRVMD